MAMGEARHGERLGLLYGLLGAMLFAAKGIFIKLAYRHGVSAETFLGLRMLWSAPLFVAVIAWQDGGWLRARWRAHQPLADRSRRAPERPSGRAGQVVPAHGSGGSTLPDGAPSLLAAGSPLPAAVDAAAGMDAETVTETATEAATETAAAPWCRGDAGKIVFLGFSGYYLASYLDFLGLQYVSAGLERVLLYLGPTFVLLLSVFWLKKPVSGRQWLALLVSYLGVILVYLHDLQGGEHADVLLGSVLVLGSCLSYAFYLLGSGELVGRLGSLRLTAWASLVASAFCMLQALASGGLDMARQPAAVQGIALLTAVFCTVMPLFLTMAAVARLGAGKAAQVGMVGPVWTIFLGALILGEPAGALQLVGTAVVIAGVLILSRAGRR